MIANDLGLPGESQIKAADWLQQMPRYKNETDCFSIAQQKAQE
jgi:hypothetical protein